MALCVLGGCLAADRTADTLIRLGVAATDPTTGELVAVAGGNSGAVGAVTGFGALAVALGSAYFAITGRKRPQA